MKDLGYQYKFSRGYRVHGPFLLLCFHVLAFIKMCFHLAQNPKATGLTTYRSKPSNQWAKLIFFSLNMIGSSNRKITISGQKHSIAYKRTVWPCTILFLSYSWVWDHVTTQKSHNSLLNFKMSKEICGHRC